MHLSRKASDATQVSDAYQMEDWARQKFIWIPHDTEGFIKGRLLEKKEDDSVVEIIETGQRVTLPSADTQAMNPPKFSKVDDMASLSYLNEASVLNNLKERYFANMIYTFSGLFCVVINPYKNLNIYTQDIIERYKGKKRGEEPPHIFAIADSAYRIMLQDRYDQSILCTGESGAGKTENTKKVIQYLASVAASLKAQKATPGTVISQLHDPEVFAQGELEKQLLQANPILEAFGNAKTIKNDNSSRFGKFIRINFDTSGFIAGANIETYLLEKARVIQQAKNERSFHVFYQLLAGATPHDINELLLQDFSQYRHLSNGDNGDSKDQFRSGLQETKEAMTIMGMSDEEIITIFRVVSAVLQLGNMEFRKERNSDQATLPDNTVMQKVCHLLGLSNVREMTDAFLKPRIKVGRENVTKAQTIEQVEFAVQAITKALYERLFKWLVARINKSLDRSKRQGASFIGILDIAGFEIFETNSFEQMCINYTNEKLQQLFNHTMFVLEQEAYRKEGIQWTHIDFGLDLQPCIDLIESPRMGIFSLVDEECWFPKGSDQTLVDKLIQTHQGHAKFVKADMRRTQSNKDFAGFCLLHYAGKVEYNAAQWLKKNQDPLNENVVALMQRSQDAFVAGLWKDADNIVGLAMETQDSSPFGSRTKKGMFRTLSQLYKEQLTKLMGVLNNTNANFVRCIIPNHQKSPNKIDAHLVLDQLRCNGVLEGIRICRQGFPNRIDFQEFRQRYEILTPNVVPVGFMDARKAAEKMIIQLEIDEKLYRIGISKVFFRSGVLAALEEERDRKLTDLMISFQALARGFLARKMYQKRIQHINAVRVIQRNCAAYLKLRNWQWWRLFTKVKPLLQVTRQDEVVQAKDAELKAVKEKAEKQDFELKSIREQAEQLAAEKLELAEELHNEREICAEASEAKERLLARKKELEEILEDMEDQLQRSDKSRLDLETDRVKREQMIRDLEEQLEMEEQSKQKLQLERVQLDAKLKKLDEDNARLLDSNGRFAKEKKTLEERLTEVSSQLVEEEEKAKQLNKLKSKYESSISDLEARLYKEGQTRQDLDRSKHRLEGELADKNYQLADQSAQYEELLLHCKRLEEELQQAQMRIDEEIVQRTLAQKQLRETEAVLQELKEDLEAERNARDKAEKQKRDLNEELEAVKQEFDDIENVSAAAEKMRKMREDELQKLRSDMETEARSHEQILGEMRARQTAAIESLQEQLESARKSKANVEKAKNQFESQALELEKEVSNLTSSRAEMDKRRKGAEHKIGELDMKLAEAEKERQELLERSNRLQQELDQCLATLDETESRALSSSKQVVQLDLQLTECRAALQDETKAKLKLQSQLREADVDRETLREQLDEFEEEKRNTEKHINSIQQQMNDFKKKVEEDSRTLAEQDDIRNKLRREYDALLGKHEELIGYADKQEKAKRKLQSELEDAIAAGETARTQLTQTERRYRKYEKDQEEARLAMERLTAEKEATERESRDRETRALNLQRERDELRDMLEEVERAKSIQARELEELLSNKDDVGKNIHDLERSKASLELQLEEQRIAIEELEDERQTLEDANLRLNVNMQALRDNLQRDLNAKEEQTEEERRLLIRKMRELEEELDVERQHAATLSAQRKKFESELNETQHNLEQANRGKEEAVKQLRKLQVASGGFQRELEEALRLKDEILLASKEGEKRLKSLEQERLQLQEELANSERARRAALAERDELYEELQSNSSDRSCSSDEKKRLEAQIAQLQEEVDDEQANCELALERGRQTQAALEKAEQSLLEERTATQRAENQRLTLERQNKELREKVAEMEAEGGRKANSQKAALEGRIQNLEEQLENESRERQSLKYERKKYERRLKEVMTQLEDERRKADQFKDQAERQSVLVRKVKREATELEEENTRLKGAKRRAERELEDVNEAREALEKEVASLRGRVTRDRTLRPSRATRGRGADLADDNLDGDSVTSERAASPNSHADD